MTFCKRLQNKHPALGCEEEGEGGREGGGSSVERLSPRAFIEDLKRIQKSAKDTRKKGERQESGAGRVQVQEQPNQESSLNSKSAKSAVERAAEGERGSSLEKNLSSCLHLSLLEALIESCQYIANSDS